MRREIIRVDNLCYTIGKKQILNNFKLCVYDHEAVALIGERFCGKSLVGEILAGLTRADEGIFSIDGEDVRLVDSYKALRLGIHHIGTDIKLIEGLSIADNFFVLTPGNHLKQGIRRRKNAVFTNEVLRETGLDFSSEDTVSDLSTTDLYLVQMAKAIANKANLVILDDIFVGLSLGDQKRLLSCINVLKQKNISVLLIESDVKRAFAAADRIVVMQYGENMGEYYRNTNGEFDADKIKHILTKTIKYEYISQKSDNHTSKLLEFKSVSSDGRLSEASFDINTGEILGIVSEDSNAYSELAGILAGKKEVSSGLIYVEGQPCVLYHTDVQKEYGIFCIGNESLDDLLCENLSVLDNFFLSVAPVRKRVKFILSNHYPAFIYSEFSSKIGIHKKDWKKPVRFLRYDQKLRLLLYRALASGAKLIVLDGIFRGQDLFVRQYLYRFMKEYTSLGRSIIFQAETADDIYNISHHIYQLKQ